MIEDRVTELAELGLARAETRVDVRNPESGDLIFVAQAYWADGLQPDMSSPAVLELDGNADEPNELATLGYLVFTDVEAVRKHAEDLTPQAASVSTLSEQTCHASEARLAILGQIGSAN